MCSVIVICLVRTVRDTLGYLCVLNALSQASWLASAKRLSAIPQPLEVVQPSSSRLRGRRRTVLLQPHQVQRALSPLTWRRRSGWPPIALDACRERRNASEPMPSRRAIISLVFGLWSTFFTFLRPGSNNLCLCVLSRHQNVNYNVHLVAVPTGAPHTYGSRNKNLFRN